MSAIRGFFIFVRNQHNSPTPHPLMKTTPTSVRSVLSCLVTLLATPSLHAAAVTWNNALGGDWSVGANWTGGTGTGGIPGTADDVTFGDAVLTGNGTTMDENFTIDS